MKKNYIVTCVGLSDSDYDANGYSQVFLFESLNDAKDYMKVLAANECMYCKEEGCEYEILEDEELSFRMSWNGHGDQIRLQIHELS